MAIETLITDPDTFEVVRDQIGDILKVESVYQQALAPGQGFDAREWALRVFIERSNPWEQFQEDATDGDQLNLTPIVCVYYDGDNIDLSASDPIERQKYTARYNVDCYGCGRSTGTPDYGGRMPADETAAREAHRAARLVRKMLAAAENYQLGLPGVVWSHHVATRDVFQPQIDGMTVQHVVAVRLVLQVDFNEYSPQHSLANLLERVHVTSRDPDTGELLFEAQFVEGDSL